MGRDDDVDDDDVIMMSCICSCRNTGKNWEPSSIYLFEGTPGYVPPMGDEARF